MARTLELDTITEPSNSGTANITLSSNTTTTMPLVDINGGAIDATTLGAGTPSSVAATTLTSSGNATFGDAVSDATTVTGTLAVAGAASLNDDVNLGNTVLDIVTVAGTTTFTGNTTVGAAGANQTIDIASHDMIDGGLKLAGTLVTTSAKELNLISISNSGAGGAVATVNTIVHGGDHTNNTYNAVALSGGNGAGAEATVVVSGNNVTSVSITEGGNELYQAPEVLTIDNAVIGGAADATCRVATVAVTTLAATDRLIFARTTGTMKQVALSDLETFMGLDALTDGGVLLGSGSGAITAMAVLADGEMLVGDGSGDPVAESGATLRTSIGLGSVNNTADAAQTSVGALNAGSITSGFGTINNGSSTITTTGAVAVGTFTSGTINSGTFSGSTVKDHGSNFVALQSGNSAMAYSWSGSENTAVGGGYTARYNRYGSQNVVVGHKAGQGIGWSNYSGGGSKNTLVGYQAGYNIESTHAATGYNNICLGYQSGYGTSPSGSIGTGSNIICLGDNSIGALYCADTSISSSDGRDKTDVEDFTAGLDWIEAMRPITYHWDKRSWYTEYDEETGEITSESTPDGTHKKDKKHIGFIAQEVLAIEQANGFASDKNNMLTINMNEDDTAYGMKYERLVPVLVNAIKELSAKVKALEAA
jgi:hypothetical protein